MAETPPQPKKSNAYHPVCSAQHNLHQRSHGQDDTPFQVFFFKNPWSPTSKQALPQEACRHLHHMAQ